MKKAVSDRLLRYMFDYSSKNNKFCKSGVTVM
jgi:hypothetical protein